MIKILFSLTLFLSTLLHAEKETYIFKAKGEFAKELKALMKKHAKEGKVEIEEVHTKQRNFNRQPKSALSSLLGDDKLYGDIKYGKKLYNKTCYRCHGQKADKSSYPTARVLNTLSQKEIYEALFSYRGDATYGKSSRFIMRQQVASMSDEEMASLSVYIHSLSPTKQEDNKALNKIKQKEEKEAPVQGSYLK